MLEVQVVKTEICISTEGEDSINTIRCRCTWSSAQDNTCLLWDMQINCTDKVQFTNLIYALALNPKHKNGTYKVKIYKCSVTRKSLTQSEKKENLLACWAQTYKKYVSRYFKLNKNASLVFVYTMYIWGCDKLNCSKYSKHTHKKSNHQEE